MAGRRPAWRDVRGRARPHRGLRLPTRVLIARAAGTGRRKSAKGILGHLLVRGPLGSAKTTVEDAARGRGVSRATITANFPGGRDELNQRGGLPGSMRAFSTRLYEEVQSGRFPRRGHGTRPVLRRPAPSKSHEVLSTDPSRPSRGAAPPPSPPRAPGPRNSLPRSWCLIWSATNVPPASTPKRRPTSLARMVLSYIISPGRWDLEDPTQVARLVRAELLGRHRALGRPLADRLGQVRLGVAGVRWPISLGARTSPGRQRRSRRATPPIAATLGRCLRVRPGSRAHRRRLIGEGGQPHPVGPQLPPTICGARRRRRSRLNWWPTTFAESGGVGPASR